MTCPKRFIRVGSPERPVERVATDYQGQPGQQEAEVSRSRSIHELYGVGEEAEANAPATPVSINSSEDPTTKSAAPSSSGQDGEDPTTKAAAPSSSGKDIVLQFFDKTICKYVTELKDGTRKVHHVFKGENGFLKCKVFGKLKELDVPNIMLGTETR
ncbi:unnamed protein product, partial [Symbiodinium necroappetens]